MTQDNNAHLAVLKMQRDALNNEIALIEKGIERASYDACIREQWIAFNDSRIADGKEPVSESIYVSGVLTDG